MKKRIFQILFLLVSIVIAFNIIYFFIPYFRSSEMIRRKILRTIPIGTSLEDVDRITIREKKWYTRDPRNWIPISTDETDWTEFRESEVNVKITHLHYRDYGHSFYYYLFDVQVKFIFDDNFNLHDVKVIQYLLI